MKQATWPLVILALLVAWPVAADDRSDPDPIALQADKCLSSDNGASTAGMAECYYREYVAYDTHMNEVYQKVLRSTDPKSRELIREAQRRWLAYREAERAAHLGPWRENAGMDQGPLIEALHVDAIRSRIRELQYFACQCEVPPP